MKRWWTAILFVLLVTAAAWLVAMARQGDLTPLKRVTVEGELRYLSRERLQEEVVAHMEGGFFAIDLERVRRAVEGLPWVARVTVRRHWPDRLEVRVQERRAVARWGGGGLVDAQGVLFRPPADGDMKDLPLLRGRAEDAPQLLAFMRRLNGWLLPTGRVVTGLTAERRGAFSVELDGGTELVLGRLPEAVVRERLIRALPPLLGEARRRAGNIIRVDMRYPNGFAVTWGDRGAGMTGITRKTEGTPDGGMNNP
ncbi:MAG: FtsQ-type POTRA domain-containing protein [Gammaproteobacteria bacterium]|nr:FtsQ-type POTRA domain-containing protein [Gammaproteobacteria bacterium]